MAAIDFPSSPVNGQVYGDFYYDSSVTAWRNAGTKNGISQRVTTLETYPSGLVPVVPSSIATASGSASYTTSGVVTFSGTSSISLNNVFTSTYSNYRIVISQFSNSTAAQNRFAWRTGGANVAASGYEQAGYYTHASATAMAVYNLAAGGTYCALFDGTTTNSEAAFDVFGPQLNTMPRISGVSFGYTASSAVFTIGAVRTTTGYFDGFSIYPTTGTISGTIQVYGYRN